MLEYRILARALVECGIDPDVRIFNELIEKYDETTRHYHTVQHIRECLDHFYTHRSLANYPERVEVAIWFHDAIYDPRSPDNEEKSASWAETYLTSNGADHSVVASVTGMILATKSHEPRSDDDSLIIDIDLGILGAPAKVFAAYDAAIRREYYWVPEVEYRTRRAEILESFLVRDVIYKTETLRELYETQAKHNLSHKIAELRS